jgi:outer membrane protein TolC
MIQTRLFITAFLLVVLTYSTNSQTLNLSYKEAIRVALDKSYTIKTSENNRQETMYSYQYYKAMFKPRLDFNLFAPSWVESVRQIDQADGLPVYNSYGSFRMGSNTRFTYVLPTGGDLALNALMYYEDISTTLALNNSELSNTQFFNRFALELSQPVFTKNTLRENLNRAKLQFNKSELIFSREQMDIIYDVTIGFYSLYRASEMVEIANEKLINSKDAHRIALLKSEVGRIPAGDAMMAEIEKSQDEAALSYAISSMKREEDNFKLLIGLNMEQDISINMDITIDSVVINLTKAVEEALKNRLEIEEKNIDIELSQIEIDRAKRERELKGEINAYYDFTGISTLGSGSVKELYSSSIENLMARPQNRGITFTLSYPISDWGRGKAKKQMARIAYKDEKLKLENLRNMIEKEVREIVRIVEESKKQLFIKQHTQEMAQKNYKVFQMRYENGDISGQNLAIERERLSNIQLEYLDSYIAYQLATTDLKRKTMYDFKYNRSYSIYLDK